MPEFHKTKRGQIFFDYQIPKLIKSFDTIATNMEVKNSDLKIKAVDDGFRKGYNIDYKNRPIVKVEMDIDEDGNGFINIYVWGKDQEDFTKKHRIEIKEG